MNLNRRPLLLGSQPKAPSESMHTLTRRAEHCWYAEPLLGAHRGTSRSRRPFWASAVSVSL